MCFGEGFTFERFTQTLRKNRDTLMREIEVIRRDGYTFSFEERVAGIRSIAVPLRDFTGAVVAAMSVTGPAIRVTEEWMHRTLPTILAAAADISAALGYAGPDVAGPSSPAAV